MKKIIISIITVFSFLQIQGQITIYDTDLVGVGDIIYQAKDNNPSPLLNIGSIGLNQWDFTSLQTSSLDTVEFILPSNTPFSSNHPSANLCFSADQFTYVDKNINGATIVGIDDLPVYYPLLPLPLTYPYLSSVGPFFTEEVFPNVFFPDSLALFITAAQAQTIDSIKYTDEVHTDFNVDAYGTVTLPSGTFDALRLYTNQIQTLSAFVYCTDTLFGTGSGWYAIPSQLLPSGLSLGTDTLRSYQWWTNNNLAKFALVQMSVDAAGNIGTVDFLTIPSSLNFNNLSSNGTKVFSIPNNEFLSVDLGKNIACDISIFDLNGKIILKDSFVSSSNFNISSFPKGIYVVRLITDEEVMSKKIPIY